MSGQASPLQLTTLDRCRLAIGRYPPFLYDARGGGGCTQLELAADGHRPIAFDVSALQIPDLQGPRARVLGMPLPPGLVIRIQPRLLAGWLDPASGSMCLRFEAHFQLLIGSWVRAPELRIETELSTEAVRGHRHGAQGSRLQKDGQAVLVGVATVQPCGAAWLDRFLGLPDEALAVLRCRFSTPGAAGWQADQP